MTHPPDTDLPWLQRQILRHVFPYARRTRLALAPVRLMQRLGLDRFVKKSGLSGQSQRHALNAFSLFIAWAVARGYAEANPCRQIPQGARPQSAPKEADAPWLHKKTGLVLDPYFSGTKSTTITSSSSGFRMSTNALCAGCTR